MKNLRILLSLLAMVFICVGVQAEPVVMSAVENIQSAVGSIQLRAESVVFPVMAAVPVIAHAKVTPEMIKELKLKYSKLSRITVMVEEGEQYEFLVRRPDRSLIKMLLPLAESGKVDEFADKAIKNLIVGGEVEALEDGIVYMGVVSQLQGLIQPAQSFLKKA